MPKSIEMIVSLKVPDTTAITALQTLHKIGFKKIKDAKRSDYYKFFFEGDSPRFMADISKVDILVNANKHSCEFSVKKDGSLKVLVKNINGDGAGILSTLKNRLGFRSLASVEKGTLWSLTIDADDKEKTRIAEKAARELLINENYQEFSILQVKP